MPEPIKMFTNNDSHDTYGDLSDEELCRKISKDAKRGIISNETIGELAVFDKTIHGAQIRDMSLGMSIQEICDFYCIDFESLPQEDKLFFAANFLRGRVSGTFKATSALFKGMKDRDGAKSALAYLSQFGDAWAGASEGGGKLPAVPKSIRIEVLGDN